MLMQFSMKNMLMQFWKDYHRTMLRSSLLLRASSRLLQSQRSKHCYSHESQSNRFSKKSFSPSVNYTQSYTIQIRMIMVVMRAEMPVAVATLIAAAMVVATVVVVLVELAKVGLLIFNVRSVSNMVILPISVITDLTPPISLMNLWCCMILLHCNLCSIVAHSHRLILKFSKH